MDTPTKEATIWSAPAQPTPISDLGQLRASLHAHREQVITHPLYATLTTEHNIRTFMQHHVWAVWDFMSLLKTLQRRLTCVHSPWTPSGHPAIRRLINEINLTEESDALRGGEYGSHFELYLAAMVQAGADTQPITQFIGMIDDGCDGSVALDASAAPPTAAAFVRSTFALITAEPVHAQAAAFAFGREDVIPDMFEQVKLLDARHGSLSLFADYLERHIELDADEHTPMAMRMVELLCGAFENRWHEASCAAAAALTARRHLWDGVLAEISGG